MRKRTVIIILSIIVVVLLGLLFFASTRFHFFSHSTVRISYNSSQLFASVENGQTATTSVAISVDPSPYCDATCTVEMDDVVLYTWDGKQQNVELPLAAMTPKKGFGKEVHPFITTCTTSGNFLCPSSRSQETGVFIVDYLISDEEKDAISTILQENVTQKLVQQQKALDNATRNFGFITNTTLLTAAFADMHVVNEYLYEQIQRAWQLEEYERAHDLFLQFSFFPEQNLSRVLKEDLDYVVRVNNVVNQFNKELFFSISFVNSSAYYKQTQVYVENQPSLNYATYDRLNQTLQDLRALQADMNESYEQAFTVLPLIEEQAGRANFSVTFNQTLCDSVVEAKNISFMLASMNQSLFTTNITSFFSVLNNAERYCIKANETLQEMTPYVIPEPISKVYNYSILQIPEEKCTICQENSPILFIHGHSFDQSTSPIDSMRAFEIMQQYLSSDFVDGGVFTPVSSMPESFMDFPVTFRATYYFIQLLDVGEYTVSVQKTERLENYAIRLKEIIDGVKHVTGASNVTIVAHSMGGLVAREYMQLFGDTSVDKLITINTPHGGIEGNIASFCSVLGASKECEDMQKNSIFLQRLRPLYLDKIHVIRTNGCVMPQGQGDGVVSNSSAYLQGAQNYLITGDCTGALSTALHTQVLNITAYPQTLELLLQILRV